MKPRLYRLLCGVLASPECTVTIEELRERIGKAGGLISSSGVGSYITQLNEELEAWKLRIVPLTVNTGTKRYMLADYFGNSG